MLLLHAPADIGHWGLCRFRHSRSSCLQLSSPRPSTNTSSHDRAFCAIGACDSALFESGDTVSEATLVALLATLATPAKVAPSPLVSGGTPTAVPPNWMLSAPMTFCAAMLILPAAPIPASPALT